MYLTVDSLTDINNIITGLNSLTLRKINVKPYGYDKMYMDKYLIEYKLCQLIDQFNDRRSNPFFDGNERTCKMLFASNFN